MKKIILLTSLLLIGTACSKDDNKASEQVSPKETVIFPTEKTGNDTDYTITTYQSEGGKVKKILKEVYYGRQKHGSSTTTTLTYGDSKYPTELEIVSDAGNKQKIEYTYNENQLPVLIKYTQNDQTKLQTREYDNKGRVTKIITNFSGTSSTWTYSYNDKKGTIVEKDNKFPKKTTTYTVVDGNITKITKEEIERGRIDTEITEYEYDPTIKNHKASLDYRLLSMNYIDQQPYLPKYSKNVFTKEITKGGNGEEVTNTNVYTYEKNEQGFPTQVKVQYNGRAEVVLETYTY